MVITDNVLSLAQTLWDYHHVNHEIKPADVIMAQGSNDLRVPERAAQLYLDGYAPKIIMSGGLGNFTEGFFDKPEADKFKDIALEMSVPEEAIIIENKSTNTGENVEFVQATLNEINFNPQFFILVQKPFMERRTFATFKKRWPEKDITVTSPQIPFSDYPNEVIELEYLIHVLVGDFDRIVKYPALGFQIEQEVTPEAVSAFEQLVLLGFTQHLVAA